MKVVGIIQARMGSTRLEGKVLRPLAGDSTLLEILVRRLAPSGLEWWIATSDHPRDDVLEEIGQRLGLNVFRGSEEDVLSRFVGIIRKTQPDWIVRVTADDPLMDAETVKSLVRQAAAAGPDIDLIGDLPPRRQFPLGFVPSIARASALTDAERNIPEDQFYHRIHVSSFIPSDRCASYTRPELPSRPDWRWTVDTPEDLEMMRALFSALGSDWPSAGYVQIVDLLEQHPEIVAMNIDIRQKHVQEG